METATSQELFVRAFAEFLRSLLFEIAPWFVAGLLIAVPLAWLLFRFRKSGMSLVGLGVLTGLFTCIISAVLAGTHLFLSFGEAFGSAVDRDRPKAFIALAVAFPIFISVTLLKNHKTEK
jgi:hypothetical protein